MDRRDALRALAATAGTVAFSGPPFVALASTLQADDRGAARRALDRLRGEPAASAFVRSERGGPRLFVNGQERYPFLATSFGLPALASTFRDGGITMFNPLVGTHGVWLGPGRYEWEGLDHYFALLLDGCADANLLPRLHLNPPRWWKEQHSEELIGYGVQPEAARYRLPQGLLEGTLDVSMWSDLDDVSLASKRWRADAGDFLRAFVRHLRTSPLAGRVFGCHFGGGLNGEWHCKGGAYFPDSGPAMRRAVGAAAPSVERRLGSHATLLRDPRTDGDVIRFYRAFHRATADAIVHFARIVKDASDRQWLAGVFYLYLLENIRKPGTSRPRPSWRAATSTSSCRPTRTSTRTSPARRRGRATSRTMRATGWGGRGASEATAATACRSSRCAGAARCSSRRSIPRPTSSRGWCTRAGAATGRLKAVSGFSSAISDRCSRPVSAGGCSTSA
jgi:hypothetical protein